MLSSWTGKSLRCLIFSVTGLLAFTLLAPSSAFAVDDPNQISFTLEGCRLETKGANFDEYTVTCADPGYTTGNLGKLWAELDLVPHRVTLVNGGGDQTYRFVVGGDQVRTDGQPAIGWDYISPLTLNTSLSDASCQEFPDMGPQIIHQPDGFGGADFLISRTVDLTQLDKTTCVYDYYQRIAVGGTLYSGSSLQSNLYNQLYSSGGIGLKRIQLQLSDLYQQVDKDMTATQDSSFVWNITKGATPVSVGFGDTCDPANPLELPVEVTIN
ncbi:MAG: hypothetical protein C0608_04545, partial [Deltaproteobacteria bacterium]